MEHETAAVPETAPVQSRMWVWHCTDESIMKGQFSIAALIEIGLAVAAYWWIAMHFDWPVYSITCLIAAPILLLRSPESVQMGVKLLHGYWKITKISRTQSFAIVSVSTFITGALAWALASEWLLGHSGFSLFWRILIIDAISVYVSVSVSVSASVSVVARSPATNSATSTITNAIISAVVDAVVGVVAVTGATAGAISTVVAVSGADSDAITVAILGVIAVAVVIVVAVAVVVAVVAAKDNSKDKEEAVATLFINPANKHTLHPLSFLSTC